MLTVKALAIMALWTVSMISIFNYVGFPNHFSNPIWALGAAVMLIITLIGNVWIFIGVAQEEPWEWSDSKSESE